MKYAYMVRGYTQRRRAKCWKLEEGRLYSQTGVKRIFFITTVTLLLTHLIACLWFLFARLNHFNPDTWVYKRNIQTNSAAYQYLVAFYWSV